MLYPHNKAAFEKVMRSLSITDRACIVHSTGTGKAYIASEVSKHFKNVLYVVPNVYIQEHTQRLVGNNVHFAFYHSLLARDFIMPKNLDLIILDEFHRAGAEKWGEKVKDVISNNPTAKVFGTTATEIRYLDGGRDMAKELFNGNVVSRITLKDAWTERILPSPIYVTGLYDIKPACDDFESRVNSNTKLGKEKRKEALKRVNSVRMDFLHSFGISDIIKKHIGKDAKRILVFCDKIKSISAFELKCMRWFHDAGIKVQKTYTANSKNPNSLEDVRDFMKDTDEEGVKLMLSVNMLNEGIHVEGVDVVVLLRSTMSRIIHLQQIGRCFAANKKTQPVILDLVDNLYASSAFDIEMSPREETRGERGESIRKTDVEDFIIYDYVKPFREVMDELSEDYRTSRSYDAIVEDLRAFVKEYKRRPISRRNNSRERNLATFVKMYEGDEVIEEILKDFPTKEQIEESLIVKVCEFFDEKRRCPSRDKLEERELANAYGRHKDDPRIKERWEKYSMSSPQYKRKTKKYKKTGMTRGEMQNKKLLERKEQLLKHLEEKKVWPKSTNVPKEEQSLYTYWLRHHEEDEEVNELYKKYAAHAPNVCDNKERFEKWVRENKKRPQSAKESSKEEKWAAQYLRRNSSKEWIADLFKELGIKTYAEEHPEVTLDDVLKAIKETGSKEKAAKLLRIGDVKLKNILNAV